MGRICYLRGYRQNPSNMVGHGLQYGAKWITVEQKGGLVPLHVYLTIYILVIISSKLVVYFMVDIL